MKRINNLQKELEKNDVDAVILNGPQELFYYAGTGQPCNLLIPRSGDPLLQVRRAWDFAIKETFLASKHLIEGGGVGALKKQITELPYEVKTIGMTFDILPVKLYQRMINTFPECDIVDVSALVLHQRSIKDSEELEKTKQTEKMYQSAHEVIMKNLRPGITELELSALIGYALRKQEGEGLIINRRWDANLHADGFIVSTKNTWNISGVAMNVTGKGLSPAFPQGASTTVISDGDLLVADIALYRHGYHADIARTYVVGEANERQKEIFDMAFQIEEVVLSSIKSGVLAEDVYFAALEKAKELKIDEYFMGHGKMQGNYIGHGLGLEINGEPTLMEGNKTKLEENMVLAVEPKIIIPEWGAIHIEDDLIVTSDGYELISTVPRKLFEVK